MLPAVHMLVSQYGESPLGSGLPLLGGPLAILLWGVLCAFYKGQNSLSGSSGKMGMTILIVIPIFPEGLVTL